MLERELLGLLDALRPLSPAPEAQALLDEAERLVGDQLATRAPHLPSARERARATHSANTERTLQRLLVLAAPEHLDGCANPLATLARRVGKSVDRTRDLLFPFIRAEASKLAPSPDLARELKAALDIDLRLIERALRGVST
jgi:hypothetical protein